MNTKKDNEVKKDHEVLIVGRFFYGARFLENDPELIENSIY